LKALSYQLSSYANPVEALESFKANPQHYDLIFTDLPMPGMDDVRLISRVRELQPDKPVILCTGYLSALEPVKMYNIEILIKPSSCSPRPGKPECHSPLRVIVILLYKHPIDLRPAISGD
jgi:DNA-binding NtrC family response regulator